ncbi:MAG: ABC transporter permease subunit [Rhodospirillaceae bacterium]|nr:ABC transporter permease subunit [Rhodospirillaceae bacterium]
MLWDGLQMTVLVGLCALVVALLMGLIGALAKLSRSKALRTAAQIYTTVVRGVPELLIILLVYYGVPTLIQDVLAGLGHPDVVIDFDRFTAGVLTIGFIYGAFATEVFRGAFLAVPRGQIEAAQAFGMNPRLVLWRITLPQVWRFALPGLGNIWLILIKATALISVIQLDELTRRADMAARAVHLPFTFFFVTSLIYLGITAVSMAVQGRAERWARRGVRSAV